VEVAAGEWRVMNVRRRSWQLALRRRCRLLVEEAVIV